MCLDDWLGLFRGSSFLIVEATCGSDGAPSQLAEPLVIVPASGGASDIPDADVMAGWAKVTRCSSRRGRAEELSPCDAAGSVLPTASEDTLATLV